MGVAQIDLSTDSQVLYQTQLTDRFGGISHEEQKCGVTLWLTGLSGGGKTTITRFLEKELRAQGYRVAVLDGDVVRQNLTQGLGFSKEDRDQNVRRIGFVADLLTRNGVIVIVSAISPYRAVREEMRQHIGNFRFGSTQAFLALLDTIRAGDPTAAVRSNVIVGFPGRPRTTWPSSSAS
jgi:adenylylsulfate kinase